jgi:aminoglycoside N3'-acetyltransferase
MRSDKTKTPRTSISKEDIKAGLKRLGLKRGDIVGVHSSLSSLGHVKEGADAVIDALLETVGTQGNIVMSTHSANLSEDWHKMLELDGYILLIGVGLEVCTAMHLAEKRVEFPERILKKITPPKWFVEKYSSNEWEWDFGPYPDFAKLEEPCIKRGIMKTVKVGEATLKFVRLRELIDLYTEYLTNNPDLFYHD